MASSLIALPRLMAHRGHSALAPENTLAAVRTAFDHQTQWVELDVQLLGDGTPVIWHDDDVSRCSDGLGRLAELDWPSVRTLDVGSWFDGDFADQRMAHLDDMLALLEQLGMGVNLELKVYRKRHPDALVDKVVPRLLEALPPERIMLSSFDEAALLRCRRFAGPDQLALGVLSNFLPLDWRRRCARLEAYSLNLNWARLRAHQVAKVHDAGLALLCYTPNNPAAFNARWDWGVDCAITDDPRLFKQSQRATG